MKTALISIPLVIVPVLEPQIIKKQQTRVSDEIETKILSMYGRGLDYADISEPDELNRLLSQNT